jgi:flagellar biogenesis protein FliO
LAASNQAVSLAVDDPAPGDAAAPDISGGSSDDQTAGADPRHARFEEEASGDGSTGPRRTVPPRAATGPSPSSQFDPSPPWYRTGLGSLAIVLALIGAAYAIIRRLLPGARMAGMDGVRVVGRAALSPKHTLALIHLGRRFVLVALAGDRVRALCEVTDPGEVAELAAQTGTILGREDRGFDATLLTEAADFSSDDAQGAADEAESRGAGVSRPPRAPGQRVNRPVAELLGRLQELQAK